jgi:hypothetical protein
LFDGCGFGCCGFHDIVPECRQILIL